MLLVSGVFGLSYDVIVLHAAVMAGVHLLHLILPHQGNEQLKPIWFLSHSSHLSLSAHICCNHSVIHLCCSSLEVICQFQLDRLVQIPNSFLLFQESNRPNTINQTEATYPNK